MFILYDQFQFSLTLCVKMGTDTEPIDCFVFLNNMLFTQTRHDLLKFELNSETNLLSIQANFKLTWQYLLLTVDKVYLLHVTLNN